jgi:hypothetical protein
MLSSARTGRCRVRPTRLNLLKGHIVAHQVFKSGPFRGVDVRDAFAQAALQQSPVTVDLRSIPWPAGLAPTPVALGNYPPGTKITGPLSVKVDVLVVLYTELETSALLEVFTGNSDWSAERSKSWCGYAHNFSAFKSIIEGISGDPALEQGIFGYLSALTIGNKTVVLYKTELHPKQNGSSLPFVPVMAQLIGELAPTLVISTGTAGAIGGVLNCGDVAICNQARFHCRVQYPNEPDINKMSAAQSALGSPIAIGSQYLDYAAVKLSPLALPGLAQCHARLEQLSGFGFVKANSQAPRIFINGTNPVPGPEPMAIVSADYLTVDDNHDAEGLQQLGIMTDTDDAFLFYAISTLSGAKPNWLSIRNASEPQIVAKPFPAGTSSATIIDMLKGTAGTIYGIYQYCTTLNSAFACWGSIAGS